MATLSLTVQVPFGGVVPVLVRTSATARAVVDIVSAALDPATTASSSSAPPEAAPRCIVFQGRVLPDDTTLADAGIPTGAVLHLMRRPSAPDPPPPRPTEEPDADISFSMVYGHLGPEGIVTHTLPHQEPVPPAVMGMISARMRAQEHEQRQRDSRPRQPPLASAAAAPTQGRAAAGGGAPAASTADRARGSGSARTDSESARQPPSRGDGDARSPSATGFLINVEQHSFREHVEEVPDHHRRHHRHDQDHDRNHDDDGQHHHDHSHEHNHGHGRDHMHGEAHIEVQVVDFNPPDGNNSDGDRGHMHVQVVDLQSGGQQDDHGHQRNHGPGESQDTEFTHTHHFTFGGEEDPHRIPNQSPNQTNVFYIHRDGDAPIRYIDAYDAVCYIFNSLGYNITAQHNAAVTAASVVVSSQLTEESGMASYTALESAWFEARRAQELVGSSPSASTSSTALATIPIEMPRTPPGTRFAEREAGRVGVRTLLPSLAGMLRSVASEIDAMNPDEMFGDSRREQLGQLMVQLGALGATLPSTTALLSTVVSPTRAAPTGASAAQTTTAQGNANSSSTEAANEGRPLSRSMPSSRDTLRPTTGPEQRQSDSPRTASAQLDRSRGQSGGDDRHGALSGSSSRSEPSSRQRPSFSISAHIVDESGMRLSSLDDEEAVDPSRMDSRTEEEQSANADFAVRVLGYYFKSFSEEDIPEGMGPPSSRTPSADGVMDSLFGSGERPQPAERILRVIRHVMQAITPEQFHEVARGDFSCLNSLDIDLWEFIKNDVWGVRARDVTTAEAVEVIADDFNEAVHTFIHIVERLCNQTYPGRTADSDNFCTHVMTMVNEKVQVCARLVALQRHRSIFGEDLLLLLKVSVAELCTVLRRSLRVSSEELVELVRKALGEVGTVVLGEQFSAIFSILANLYGPRAVRLHEDFREDIATLREDFSDGVPSELRGPFAPRYTAQEVPSRSAISHGGESQGNRREEELPDLVESNEEEEEMPPLLDEDDCYSNGDEGWGLADEDEGDHDESFEEYASSEDSRDHDRQEADGPNISIYGRRSAVNSLEQEAMELDDYELDELARELECDSAGKDMVHERDRNSLDDFDDIVRELEQEQVRPEAAKASTDRPRKVPARSEAKRMAGMFGSSMARPGLASGLSSGLGPSRASNSSAISRATFSSAAAVPRAAGATAASRVRDEFDEAMGAEQAEVWRRIVGQDEAKLHRSVHGPLSRGYQYERGSVAELTAETAVELGIEDVRAACREAQLPESAAREVEAAMRENGGLYLRELENAITSRMSTDPDFDDSLFPAAARRFGRSS